MRLKNGVILLSSLIILSSCTTFGFGRKKSEPVVEWCSAYEDGSWECLRKDNKYQTRLPSEMQGYMALPIEDAEMYRKFCVRRRD